MTAHPRPPLRATYRVQLHAGFTFDDAAAIVPYLVDLGVSHLYCSPVLQAAPGSTHGYDVIDHGRVNDELGGEAGFDRLTDALRAHGLGLVLDIVPNHMSIAGEGNRWWWDVLRHGPASRYASWFDVDWDPPESRLRNVILLPVLADHYGRVLEAGEIRLARDGGSILATHADRRFPLDPRTLDTVLASAADRAGSDELAFIAQALGELPPSTSSDAEQVARRQRDAEVLAARLDEIVAADPALASAVDGAVDATNADVDRLDAILDDQNYRLAYWRAASRDLAYRRFFDIDELIGLRMEVPEVFDATHELPLRWVREGRVHGLRVDHPDGLRDPAAYFARLRSAAPDAWIVAEKILAFDEELREDWAVDGTTGYRFANLATGVLVDPAGEEELDRIWAERAGEGSGWEEVEAESRAGVLATVLGSDANRLADLFLAVCEENRRYRDYTRHELHHAVRELAASLPVYRTYIVPGSVGAADRALIADAARRASERRPDLDPELFAFLAAVLVLEVPGRLAEELAMRFQQLTPAAMAKGVEDTAFYRHHRLVALNEVGGDPGRWGTSPDDLHARLAATQRERPREMQALSTHDTKRSADVRARIALLSQDPDGWRRTVETLSDAAARHRAAADLPSRADEYLLAQTVVGAWPLDADRAVEYMRKASREAKLRTSWTSPDAEYDEALEQLVRGSLGDAEYVRVVEAFVAGLRVDARRASLAQAALHLMAPGVPDLYQGTELLDLSLVDPDNRRPVDYARRRELLADVATLSAAEAWARGDDDTAKLWLVNRVLGLRRRRPAPFESGDYAPLAATGALADGVVGFVRGGEVATVVPRSVVASRAGWQDTAVALPEGRWCGADDVERGGAVRLDTLLADFPVAILERVE